MNFTCPYCSHHSVLSSANKEEYFVDIAIDARYLPFDEKVGFRYMAVACPNSECKQLSLRVELVESVLSRGDREPASIHQTWSLLPESSARPQPFYIPNPIVNDYIEATRIKDLSPKASATLARRCLQGMIRDFWSIRKATLKLEIDELENHVTPETWDAINAIRSVGNIGAHMEKDVDVIIDIEPDEAELLISLIEDLFEDWYVTRHARQERQRKIKELAEQKAEARKPSVKED